jgi:hypothetical protein
MKSLFVLFLGVPARQRVILWAMLPVECTEVGMNRKDRAQQTLF